MNFEDAKNIVDGYSLHLLDQPGVVAVAVGTKDGGPVVGARDFCVAVYVEKKLPETALIRTAGDALLSMTTDRDHELLADSGSDAVNVVESGGRFQPLPGLQVPANQRGQYGGAPPTLDLQKRFQSPRAGIGITNPFLYPRILDVGTLGFFGLGVSGAWIGNLTALAPYQPLFVATAFGFLGAGFWRVYRRPACDGPACPRPAPNRLVTASLWGAAVLVGVALAFPYTAPLLLS